MSMKKLGSIFIINSNGNVAGSLRKPEHKCNRQQQPMTLQLKKKLQRLRESAVAADTDVSGSTLEVAVTYTGDQATTFQGLVDKFEEEYGVTVNIAEYGRRL